MKILLFSDVHVGIDKDIGVRGGLTRMALYKAAETFTQLIPTFNALNADLIFNLGDLFYEDQDETKNNHRLDIGLSLLERIKPLPHIIMGNHELRGFSVDHFKTALTKHSLSTELYGKQIIGDVQIVWLDLQMQKESVAILPNKTLEWLKTLDAKIPTVILSHYPIVKNDNKGTYYFEKHPEAMNYNNNKEILAILQTKKIIACLAAHCHWFSYTKQVGTHFITIPAFSENIAASAYIDNNPGAYSILEIKDQNIIFKSYAGGFPFVNLELSA